MIGHRLNGCTIVAAAPAEMSGHYVILAVRNTPDGVPDGPGEPYATAWVHVSQMPNPAEWWTGHYFGRIEDAAEDFLARSAKEPIAIGFAVTAGLDYLRHGPSLQRGNVVAQMWDSPVNEGYTTVQIDTTGHAKVNVDLNDGRLFHGDPNDSGNTFQVIRRAALAFLHGDDSQAIDLKALADALDVPHGDVEAITDRDEALADDLRVIRKFNDDEEG